MSNNSYTYNVLIARFRDFVAGHYILQRFTHGQLSDADLAKNNLYPWLHVVPEGINFSEGTKTYNFSVMIADLPREKGEKNANQAEVISDCLQIFSDLIATIENGVLFGRDIMLGTPVNVEAFIQENSNSLTGVEGTLAITVDYNWDACDVPADFNPFTPITGEPPTFGALQFNNSLNLDNGSVTLDNDVELPGNTFYYGTNAEGVKGWYALPSGSSFTCSDVDACPTIVAMLADIANKANSADLGAVAFSNDYNDLDNIPATALTAPPLDSQRSAELGNEYVAGDVVYSGGNVYRCLATNSGIAVTDPNYWVLVGPGYQTRQRIIDYNASTGDAQIINKPTLFSGDYNDLTNAPALAAVATSGDYADLINTPDLSGYGDMLKSTYDVDNDGVVDMAKKEVVEVINKTGATLTKGTICYIKSTSSSGTHPEVLKANANSEATSSKTMGAIYEDIPNDNVGFLVTSGEVRNLDTSAYNTGALLWLSTTDGQVTTTPPAEPNHTVFIGHVTRSQNVNGRVLYAIQNGYELTELHGVQCPSPATNDVLKYDGSLWVNGALTKSDVGLSNVDNTSDANKPVSTATQTALNAKENTITAGTTSQYYRGDKSFQTLDKTAVGLANVDNTSDLDKPISTATQSALDAKISTAKSFLTGTHQSAIVAAGGTSYNGFCTGGFVIVTNEFQRRNLIPLACTLSNFTINLGACSGTGTVVATLRKNGVDSAVVITVACPSVSGFFAATGTLACAANDIISYKVQNTTAASTGALVLSSIVVEI